jgi:predicted AlkP superfamily phosphohydrolase/phosphomutase
LNNPGFSARDFQKILLDEIRNEYNHNVSQQVYMGEEVWSQVKNAKEDLIILINEAATRLAPDATSIDLSKKIFEMAMDKQVDLIGHALTELKKEIQQIF